MRNALLLPIVCALLSGCATGAKDITKDIVYTDERSAVVPGGAKPGKKADVLVRVRELQGPAGAMIPVDGAPPADASLIAEVESYATFGTPFYCTVGLPRERVELAALIKPDNDGHCRIECDYRHRFPMGGVGSSTNVMLSMGQTRVLMSCVDGRMLTIALEPVAEKSATIRP